MWTLETNGIEKALAAWGIGSDFTISRPSMGKTTATFLCAEPFDAGVTQFAANQFAKIWRGRVGIGVGGTIWAQGYFDDPERHNDGGEERVRYQLHNVFWLLERNFFQQTRNQVVGYTDHDPIQGTPIYGKAVCAEVFMGQSYLGTTFENRLTSGEQAREVIEWLNEIYNPTKRGHGSGRDDRFDVVKSGAMEPHFYFPVTRGNALLCREVLQHVTRWAPDAVLHVDDTQSPPVMNLRSMAKWDYTTSPPTFVDYSNLPEVVIHLTADQEKQIKLKGTDGTSIAGVAIYYHSTDEIDGAHLPHLVIDYAPANVTSFTPEIAVFSVDLEGETLTTERAKVEVEQLSDLLDADATGQKDWVLQHDQTMKDNKIDANTIVVTDVKVVDRHGNPVDLAAFPNFVAGGTTLPKWTSDQGVNVIRGVIQIEVAFSKYTNSTHHILDHKSRARVLRKSVKLTNAETREYLAVKDFQSADAIPQGVAESLFRSASCPQHQGTITLVGEQIPDGLTIGKRVKAIGPTTTFENLLIQQIDETPHRHTLTLTFGPFASLTVDYLVEMSKAVRGRTTYKMPAHLDTGKDESDAEVDTSADTGEDDTAHGVGGNEDDSVTYEEDAG